MLANAKMFHVEHDNLAAAQTMTLKAGKNAQFRNRCEMIITQRHLILAFLLFSSACNRQDAVAVPRKPPIPAPVIVLHEEWGTLEGQVVFKGELPKIDSLVEIVRKNPDAKHVLRAPPEQLLDPTWRIDPKTKAVANVVVFIKRPANGILPIHQDDKTRKATVALDAPFTIFVPHMVALFPEWSDGKNRGATGETFVIKNSSPVSQCARLHCEPRNGGMRSYVISQGKEIREDLKPDLSPIPVKCHCHSWKSAYVWVFDHPYFAITNADGAFTIPRVPAGLEVQVMAWHESQGWLFTKDGKTMTLKAGKNTLDFEIGVK
jgi:hypothetical protein